MYVSSELLTSWKIFMKSSNLFAFAPVISAYFLTNLFITCLFISAGSFDNIL